MTSRARAKQRRREAESPPPLSLPSETRRSPLVGLLGDFVIVLAGFAAVSAIAAALGAANFGTALAFGQLGFALALAYVLVRRR
jgi:hypothetical protein